MKLLGRAARLSDGIWPDWAASGFEFDVSCGGTLSCEIETNWTSSYGTYFRVFADGLAVSDRVCVKGSGTYVFTDRIPAGAHTIRIVRESDNYNRELVFKSITLHGDESTFRRAADRDLFIEAIGTSITSGSGILCPTVDGNNQTYNAASLTYAYQLAQLLHADHSNVSKGSMGVIKQVDTVNFPILYTLAYGYRDLSATYTYTRHPDIVVMDIGPNDSAYKPEDVWIEASCDLIRQVREQHPFAKIVIPFQMMGSNHTDNFPVIVEKMGGAANGVYCVKCKIGRSGGGNHPNQAEAYTNATIIADFIRANVLDGTEWNYGGSGHEHAKSLYGAASLVGDDVLGAANASDTLLVEFDVKAKTTANTLTLAVYGSENVAYTYPITTSWKHFAIPVSADGLEKVTAACNGPVYFDNLTVTNRGSESLSKPAAASTLPAFTCTALGDKVLLLGGASIADGAAKLNLPGSSVAFTADAAGDLKAAVTLTGSGEVRLRTYVDGVGQPTRTCVASSGTYTLAYGMRAGHHEIRIVLENVPGGTVSLTALGMMGDSTSIAPVASPSSILEVIGDELAAGYYVLGQDGNPVSAYENSASNGYAYRTAQNLGSDVRILSSVGANVADGSLSALLENYKEPGLPALDNETPIIPIGGGASANPADVVVVEIGSYETAAAATFEAKLKELCLAIREKNPTATVVIVTIRASGAASYDASVASVLTQLGGESAGFLSVSHEKTGKGTNAAPDREECRVIAEKITALVQP